MIIPCVINKCMQKGKLHLQSLIFCRNCFAWESGLDLNGYVRPMKLDQKRKRKEKGKYFA